jgi:hypothetical protein
MLATVDVLLAHSADVTACDSHGLSPLALAAAAGAPDRVLERMTRGVSDVRALLTATDQDGRDALAHALAAGQHSAASWLRARLDDLHLAASAAPTNTAMAAPMAAPTATPTATPTAATTATPTATATAATTATPTAATTAATTYAPIAAPVATAPSLSGGCDVVDEDALHLDASAFVDRYAHTGVPVVLRGAVATRLSRAELLADCA